MEYSILKAFHIVFMVSYFAGIFYLVRLFVYYKDTDNFEQPKKQILREQYIFMLRRLWNIILAPAGVLMLLFGISLLIINPILLKTGWFHIKLLGLFGLGIYHFWAWKKVLFIKNLNGKDLPTPNIQLRQFNEIATFILFLVVFSVILKHQIIEYWWQLIIGFLAIVFLIMSIVKVINKKKK